MISECLVYLYIIYLCHYASPTLGLLGFTDPLRAMMAALRPPLRSSPRADIMVLGQAIKPRIPRIGVE
jgi:hypothetical protein